MRFPLHQITDTFVYQAKQTLKGRKRFPFVLMLEPLYTCNLACIGCSTERHSGKLGDRLPVEKCLRAVEDCGVPIVSLCGGEPTLYPELKELLDSLVARRKHVYLCTNALRLEDKVFGKIPPNKRISINVHLDGMRETHDMVCNRAGVFDQAIKGIKEAKRLGYHVLTNTTVYKETDMAEVEALCAYLNRLGVDGMMVAPGYHYETVEKDIFLTRNDIHEKFKRVLGLSKKYRLQSTPMYLEFAAGMRDYKCSPWSTVTFTPRGWKGPCYLVGKSLTFDWHEFWNNTDWEYWESRKDKLCQNCAMHSGFEASAVMNLGKHKKDLARMAIWNFT